MDREQVIENQIALLRQNAERLMYEKFLSSNYKLYQMYCQLRQHFSSYPMATTKEEIELHEKQLRGVNATILQIQNIIISLEKDSETLLFSD